MLVHTRSATQQHAEEPPSKSVFLQSGTSQMIRGMSSSTQPLQGLPPGFYPFVKSVRGVLTLPGAIIIVVHAENRRTCEANPRIRFRNRNGGIISHD